MKHSLLIALAAGALTLASCTSQKQSIQSVGSPTTSSRVALGSEKTSASPFFAFEAQQSDGTTLPFKSLEGKVVLVVNTASKCGFTPQFADLEALYEKYRERGLVVVGFPSGDFANQELSDGAAAAEFCRLNYGVSFPIMEKVHVNGADASPVFAYLKSEKGFAGFDAAHPLSKVLDEMLAKADAHYASKPDIKWNFTKFLVSRSGRVLERFEPTAGAEQMTAAIEAALAESK